MHRVWGDLRMQRFVLDSPRPHGLSTKMRVLAFCPDDQIEEDGLKINHFAAQKKKELHEIALAKGNAWSWGWCCRCIDWESFCLVHLQCKSGCYSFGFSDSTWALQELRSLWDESIKASRTKPSTLPLLIVKSDCNRRLDGLWQMPRHPQYYVPFLCILCKLQKCP